MALPLNVAGSRSSLFLPPPSLPPPPNSSIQYYWQWFKSVRSLYFLGSIFSSMAPNHLSAVYLYVSLRFETHHTISTALLKFNAACYTVLDEVHQSVRSWPTPTGSKTGRRRQPPWLKDESSEIDAIIHRGVLSGDEGQLCFNEARDSGYSPAQLRALFVTLIVDGDERGREILESNSNTLTADSAEEASLPSDVVWNRCLQDIATRLETMGSTMMDFGLPEPADDSTELARERLRWNHHSCQGFVDVHLPLLTPDEQRPVYEEVSKVRYQFDAHICITSHTTSNIGFESSIHVYITMLL